jgi:2-oxoglutarate/2-oxoacid ferredoxin oxidoreductase subunit alpha
LDEYSILFGGKAGDGIDRASLVVATLFKRLGYYVYIYREYPSLIRGGHTFSIIRAAKTKIFAHFDEVDVILAMNQETVDLHSQRMKKKSVLVFDPAAVAVIIKEEDAPPVTANSVIIGKMAKVLGIEWDVLEEVFRAEMPKAVDKNLAVARRGYTQTEAVFNMKDLVRDVPPIATGNEAMGLGLAKGGLDAYFAYPMTPTSTILHYLAGRADELDLTVVHPESEIGVILMALGASYTGQRVAVGTSGGGFCLMTEGFSLAGMAELPIVVVLGQRPGPSTGLPTYSSQTELHFALNAGQGEFARLVIAPGDAEESYYWAQVALGLSEKYRTPAIILTDKNLGEGTFSFDEKAAPIAKIMRPPRRDPKAVFKVNGYEHDKNGITIEDVATTVAMQDKRLAKIPAMAKELAKYPQVGIYGDEKAKDAILCWGSNKGVVIEAAGPLGLKVIQPVVMSPFPFEQFKTALTGVENLVAVESNATAQLVKLINQYGFDAKDKILKYDGRAFSVGELRGELERVIKRRRS